MAGFEDQEDLVDVDEDDEEVVIIDGKRKHAGGRPQDPARAHFTTVDGQPCKPHASARCVFCTEIINDSRIGNLRSHLSSSCRRIPAAVKVEYCRQLSKNAPTLPAPDKRSKLCGSTISSGASQSTAKPKGPLDRLFDTSAISVAATATLHRKLLLAFVQNGISFRAIEDDYMLDFLNTLRPSFQPPSTSCMQHACCLLHVATVACKANVLWPHVFFVQAAAPCRTHCCPRSMVLWWRIQWS
jgi:hypothetical protein